MSDNSGHVRKPSIFIVSRRGLQATPPDDLILSEALAHADADAKVAAWDDPKVDWKKADAAIIRSAWNYYEAPAKWAVWLERVSGQTQLHNPPNIVKWNGRKSYLQTLADCGLPIVDTIFLPPSSNEGVLRALEQCPWSDIIIKPMMGASAHGVRRFAQLTDDAVDYALTLASGAGALMQPFLPSVDEMQERSLVSIGGRYSHAFRKPSFNEDASGTTEIEEHRPSKAELSLAQSVFALLGPRTLYARLDLVYDGDEAKIMEVELIEPDLGLRIYPEAAAVLAQKLVSALSSD